MKGIKAAVVALTTLATLTAVGVGAELGAATTAGAATTQAAGRSTAATPAYVVYDCNKAQVKPGTIFIACADGGVGLQGLHWTSWTPELASGYGTFWENDCIPYCAAGHIHHYQALVMLWGSASVPGHQAERRYVKITAVFPGSSRPPVYTLVKGKLVASYPLTQIFDAR